MKGMSNGSFYRTIAPSVSYSVDRTGPDPLRAIQLIDSLVLHRSIFAPPPSTSPSVGVPDALPHHTALAAATILHRFVSIPSFTSSASASLPLATFPPSDQAISDSRSCSAPPSIQPSSFNTQLPAPHPTLLSHALAETSAMRRLFLAAAVTPFKSLTYQDKKKTRPLVEACIREALKVTSPRSLRRSFLSPFSYHSIAWGAKSLR